MAVHQTSIMSGRGPPVADTFGTVWEKNKCRQTRHFIAGILPFDLSQDIAAGIANFLKYLF